MTSGGGNGLSPNGRYRAVNIQRFPIGDGLELAVREQDHVGVVIRPEIAAALQACQPLATLHAHAVALRRALAGGALDVLDPALLCQELRGVKLLEPETAFLERCQLLADPNRDVEHGTIRTFGWITSERPSALERSVTSHLANSRSHGRRIEAVVIDGSPSSTTRAHNQDALRRVARAFDAEIRYSGPAQRAAYASALAARADVPRALVDFALGDPHGHGCAIGASRNALLLDTLGSLVLSADDDVVCRPTAHPNPRNGLCLSGNWDPTDLWSFADRARALAFAPAVDADIAAAHEAVLGCSLTALARQHLASNRLQWGHPSPADVRVLEAGTGHVMLTFTGVVGDSGMPTHTGLLWGLREPSRSRLFGDEAAYRTALDSREVLRVAPAISAGAFSHCMATAFGLDNRSLLPPFMPVRRNEDGLFGAVLGTCHDTAVFAHLPLALLHDAAPRESSPRLAPPIARRQLSDILMFAVLSYGRTPGAHPCSTRLQRLGAHLQGVGALALRELERFLRLQLAAQASAFFATLDWVKRQYGNRPAYWAADVTRCAHESREALQHPDTILPRDIGSSAAGRHAVLDMTRGLVRKFGELLCAWPEIVATARELREEGIRVSRVLSQ